VSEHDVAIHNVDRDEVIQRYTRYECGSTEFRFTELQPNLAQRTSTALSADVFGDSRRGKNETLETA
jgi:hypothetical protein